MKQTIITFCILLALTFSAKNSVAQGQNLPPQADSIIAILPELTGEERLEALSNVTRLLSFHPKNKHYLRMLIDEAKSQNKPAIAGWAFHNLSTKYFGQFDCDNFFIITEEGIRFAREHELYIYAVTMKNFQVIRLVRNRQVLTAMRIADDAYELAWASQNFELLATVKEMIGQIYFSLENFEESIRYFTESIDIMRDNDIIRPDIAWDRYYRLAYMARYINRPDEMLRYVDSMHSELRKLAGMLEVSLPNVFFFKTEYQTAIAFAELGQGEQARQAIRRAEALFDPQMALVNRYFAILIDDMWGTYHLFVTRNYGRAIAYLNNVLDFFVSTAGERGILFTKNRIALAHFKAGNHRVASEMYQSILERRASINKDRFNMQINEFRTIFELDRSELASARKLIVIQQLQYRIRTLFIVGIALVLIVILVVWNHYRIAKKNRGLFNQIMEQDRLAEELQQLRGYVGVENFRPLPTDSEPDANAGETLEHCLIVARIHNFLIRDRNFANPDLDIQTMEKELKISRTYLYQKVKKSTGKTLNEYIDSLRLEESRRLLGTTDDKIDVIAEMCGYSKSTFYRQFREKYNITPTVYKKLCKEGKG